MDDTGLELSRYVQRNSDDLGFDDAQNDAPDSNSAMLARADAEFQSLAGSIHGPDASSLLARFLDAWNRLSGDDRLRLVDDAERLTRRV